MFNKEQILSSFKEEICELCAQVEHGPRLDAGWLVTTTTTKTVFVPSIMRYRLNKIYHQKYRVLAALNNHRGGKERAAIFRLLSKC